MGVANLENGKYILNENAKKISSYIRDNSNYIMSKQMDGEYMYE